MQKPCHDKRGDRTICLLQIYRCELDHVSDYIIGQNSFIQSKYHIVFIPLDMELLGSWKSTEAFGNTGLDWSKAIRSKDVILEIEFREDGTFSFNLFGDERVDVTSRFKHVPTGRKYHVKGNQLNIEGMYFNRIVQFRCV